MLHPMCLMLPLITADGDWDPRLQVYCSFQTGRTHTGAAAATEGSM